MVRNLKLVVLIGCVLLSTSVGHADWVQQYPTKTTGAEVTTPPEGEYGFAYATASWISGCWISVKCYPYKPEDEEDSASASAGLSKWPKQYKWDDCDDVPYTEFPFTLIVDLDWNVGGNSNNGYPGSGTTSSSAEVYVKCDAEPDDSDADPDYTNRWGGSKTEGQVITGIGISVWGADISWDSTSDEWNDVPDGDDPLTKTWTGSTDNDTGSGLTDTVTLTYNNSGQAACSGSNNATMANSEVECDQTTFTFTVGS